MHYETLWSFKTANFTIDWSVAPDDDVETDWDETGETQDKLASGEWVAFVSRVQVRHNATGAKLGTDYLGGSIYSDPRTFRRDSGYFQDMVREAIKEARVNMVKLQTVKVHA